MPRLRYRDKTPPSRLETKFALYWRGLAGPALEREFRFEARGRCLVAVAEAWHGLRVASKIRDSRSCSDL